MVRIQTNTNDLEEKIRAAERELGISNNDSVKIMWRDGRYRSSLISLLYRRGLMCPYWSVRNLSVYIRYTICLVTNHSSYMMYQRCKPSSPAAFMSEGRFQTCCLMSLRENLIICVIICTRRLSFRIFQNRVSNRSHCGIWIYSIRPVPAYS